MVEHTETKASPQSVLGFVTTGELNRVINQINAEFNTLITHRKVDEKAIANLSATMATLNDTLTNLQATFKKNDLLERVEKLEAKVFPPAQK